MTQHTDYAGLLGLAGEISRESDLDGLLLKILTKSLPWMRVDACSIFLPCDNTGDLVIHSAQGETAPKLGAFRVPAGKGIVGAAMLEKKLIRVDDAANDDRVYKEADKKTGWTTRALLAAPLLDGDECLGVIEFLNPQERPIFTPEDEQLVEYFAGLVAAALGRVRAQAVAIERAALQRDLDLAREMQAGLLPGEFPERESSPALELFAMLEPAQQVSGDLYDFFFVEPGKLCFVVGDVSGKGVAAGLFMAVTRTLVRAIARPGLSPAQILSAVNAELCRENDACLFVTMILGIADTATGEIVCGLGAHNPPVRLPRGGAPEFGPLGGAPLGLMENAVFSEWSLRLEAGDALVVYTDGVTEALDDTGELFSNERLLETLSRTPVTSSQDVAMEVSRSVAEHVGGAERSDDITIFVLRKRGD
ncbi:MAG: SpoIIE family protein phosphatase [Chthoniobacterales bacterium]|nr:SpoIIE family protein phosphatase [Chthoniobacterales bacterium]